MNRLAEKGFTLVELLIVAVLGTFIVLATLQVLQVTQRSYTVMHAQVQSQQSLRGGTDVLFGELREISPSDGDLLDMGSDYLTIRSMRQVGLVCGVDYTSNPVRLTVKRLGRWFRGGDSVFVFADNDPDRGRDDTWLTGMIASLDTTATCASGDEANLLGVQGLPTTDSVRPGAIIRSFQRFTYGIVEFEGAFYLGQTIQGIGLEPLVGPLRSRSEGGLEFTYLDANGVETAVSTEVAQIQVTMRTSSLARTPNGDVVSDSIQTRISLRN